jgi:hypothetical protein
MVTKHQLAKHPEYVTAIGMIALEIVDLELELSVLFSRMLMVSPKVAEAIYMTPKNDRARLDILQNAAEALFATKSKNTPSSVLAKQKIEARNRVLAIVKRCRAVIEERHRVVHDDWYISSETQEIKTMMVDGRLAGAGTKVTLDELKTIIQSLRRLIDDITKLAEEFKTNPPLMVSLRR